MNATKTTWTEESISATVAAHEALEEHIDNIASRYATITGVGWDEFLGFEVHGDTCEVRSEHYQYGNESDTYYVTFPTRYLWEPNWEKDAKVRHEQYVAKQAADALAGATARAELHETVERAQYEKLKAKFG